MPTLSFSKLQSTGNDFAVIHAKKLPDNAAEIAVKICDRHFGVGADGVLFALPSTKADIRMVIINADGSEAQACGNGLRAMTKYAVFKGLVTPVNNLLTIETYRGISSVSLTYRDNKLVTIEVSMGKPYLKAAEIPVDLVPGLGEKSGVLTAKYPLGVDEMQMGLAFVGMGNPHAIYFQDKPVSAFPLERIGPKVEHNTIFPQRTNFEVVRVISPGELEVRIWERGVGETLACGSGVCAVAVAAMLLGLSGHSVCVKVPGGELAVRWYGEGDVYLSGPSEFVYDGTIEI